MRIDPELGREWQVNPSLRLALDVVARRGDFSELRPVRIFCVRSFTIEPALSILRASMLLKSLDLEVDVSGYDRFARYFLDSSSELYAFEPDIVIVALRPQDLGLSSLDLLSVLSDSLECFRKFSRASLVFQTLECPILRGGVVPSGQVLCDETELVEQFNARLRMLLGEMSEGYVLDYQGLIAQHGSARWYSEPAVSAKAAVSLAGKWLGYICPLLGKISKVVVVDLDNTLWGGVVGESVLLLDSVHLQRQKRLRGLRERGILLAICSRNVKCDSLRVFEELSEMELKIEDFAAIRIGFDEKVESLRSISEELEIRLEHFAFLDDDPREREKVRLLLPEVVVIEPGKLAQTPELQRLHLTAGDKARPRLYEERKTRLELRERESSLEDYLYSLGLQVDIRPLTIETRSRAAQLTRRSNRCNLALRRYDESSLWDLNNRHSCQVYTMSAKDRIGDLGIIAVATLKRLCEDSAEIHDFAVSCRALSHGLESALLSYLCGIAKEWGCLCLDGQIRREKANSPSHDFFARYGFEQVDEVIWRLRIEEKGVPWPNWISLVKS